MNSHSLRILTGPPWVTWPSQYQSLCHLYGLADGGSKHVHSCGEGDTRNITGNYTRMSDILEG